MRDENIYCDVCGSKKDERSVEFFTAQFLDRNGDDLNKDILVCHVCRGEYSDEELDGKGEELHEGCLLYTSPSPRDRTRSRMPSSA